ncbi:MAG: hypothetical protein WAO58_00035 [Fimbriimonadaceae bacterium]
MRILIETRGGCLATVHCEGPAEVIFVDWDDYHDEPDSYRPGQFAAEDFSAVHPDTAELCQLH